MTVQLLGVSRRNFLEASVGVVASGVGSPRPAAGFQRSSAKTPPSSAQALVFDVFGTVVDWRTSVARQIDELGKQKGLTVDGAAFADAWRAQYAPSMDRVRKGELPWTELDQLHRMSLDQFGKSPTRRPDLQPDDSVDVSAQDFGELATQLRA